MSFDGSFSPSASLQRLLTRCPALLSDPKLLFLHQICCNDCSKLILDDLVEALADPFLHPEYTIPIVGCFRPVCERIATRAVDKLRAAPSLNSENDTSFEDEIGEEIRVLDFYLLRGRGLRLHEVACLALCRALDLAPFLSRCVLNYFKFSPPPFGRVKCMGVSMPALKKGINLLLEATRLSYRFLATEPKVFSELWDWSCFLDVLQTLGDLNLTETTQSDEVLELKWYTVQILSIVLKSSDRIIENFGIRADEAFTCYERWKKFCGDTSIEKAGLYFEGCERGSSDSIDGITSSSPEIESLDSWSLVDSLSELKVSQPGKRKQIGDPCPFILTASMKRTFEVSLMAVTQKWPVLLYGPVGSGKTALINKLASENRVLFIHMDDQMDSRTLVGSYVCTEQPGEFKWNPGSLTQAIAKGFWIVFEDIDKAPSDVQSVLLPLLEGATSFSTGHGEVVEVAHSFRIFATVTTSGTDIEGRRCSALWRQVMVRPPRREDMLDIVNTWYPSLKLISTKLLDIFEVINKMMSHQLAGSVSAGSFTRFSLRDLLKWCKRLMGSGVHYSDHGLSSSDTQTIYQEAIDVFTANLSSLEKRLSVMREVSQMLGLPAPDSVHLSYKPIIQTHMTEFQVGRVKLECMEKPVMEQRRPFVGLRSSLQVLEKIACSVKYNESVLLVGETGTGKTTLVQNLAAWLQHPLTVMNLSQQSDVTDLLGGFKPTDAQSICVPLYHEFKSLLCDLCSQKVNDELFRYCELIMIEKNWKKLLRVLQKKVDEVYKLTSDRPKSKRKRSFLLSDWESLSTRLKAALNQIGTAGGMSFKFVEGAFVTALRSGHWILLDEVNLAPQETLQRIGAVLDGERSTLCLAERGDIDYVDRHPSFRLFACMNPATDAGKRELPLSFRSRFTEYFVDDVLEDDDLRLFINKYLEETPAGTQYTEKIIQFYKAAKKESEDRLQDGARQKPQFSLRSLARALDYAKKAERDFGLKKALYDGFCIFFVTLLDKPSAKIMSNLIVSYLLDGKMPQIVESTIQFSESYIETPSVKKHLENLARAVYIKRYPVLLQGPTSSGKTSLVHNLASVTGHEFMRINNHEHTDLQEYFGSYVTDSQGRLQFQEGVLVKAVREGHWIVLDELNLAPSDVLEALNRLLDDNRELFIPELQETIQAHPEFMLFATQNPPVLYGGRKMLSRAFRNRFIELQVDEIPEDELTTIVAKRCVISDSYAKKLVEVMKELQLHRQNSRVFAGKQGFITPRDLFRWANRYSAFSKSREDLAKDGYLLLAERLRDENEKIVVREALKRHLRVDLNMDDLYKWESGQGTTLSHLAGDQRVRESFGNFTWTRSMWRLYFLVERCYKLREPVLLVGETGGGKTTVCQLLSAVLGSKLHILNCHQYTETSDFIGGFCPIRDRSRLATEFEHHILILKQSKLFMHTMEETAVSSNISQAPSAINIVNEIISGCRKEQNMYADVTAEDIDAVEKVKLDLIRLHQNWQAIFLWQDGPLVEAMRNGDLFLVDEISLADDSVLERLNSVLEPERKLSLAEKGGSVLEKITAHPNFFILATMNPGGDYGKKELSPALRNRFTEIWVPAVTDIDELQSIAVDRFNKPALSPLAQCVVNFWKWFNELQVGRTLTIRDLLSWITFVNVAEAKLGPEPALIHGAFLVLLDGLTLGTGIQEDDANKLRESCLLFLFEELQKVDNNLSASLLAKLGNYGWGSTEENIPNEVVHTEDIFGIKPFCIGKGNFACKTEGYELLAPTTKRNVLRVLRAMQLPKPVLLEGSPGVGKTSLIVALGGFSGHEVVRINLSEQTDMMDLLGSDLPVQGENGIEFSWSDGILLQALKRGSWVLLDELNLAPQSVLEGLNSILDHRAEVFIPELAQTFKCPPSFRVFACQNPSSQGGGRKSLPKSFLNRFAKVYVDELSADDYLYICEARYPSIPSSLLSKLITFNKRLHFDTMVLRKYGQQGSPWEFNLRDVIRSCQMISCSMQGSKFDFLNVVYLQRMRTLADRNEVIRLFEEVFESKPLLNPHPKLHINPKNLIIGSACIQRSHFQPSKTWINQLEVLPGTLYSLEAILHCLNQGWLCILVGTHSSGKTSLVRLLAQLTGNALRELNLSTGTDVSELLGCFEQYNLFRHYKTAIYQIERYLDEYFSLRSEGNWKEFIAERKGAYAKWFEFTASKRHSSSTPVSALMDSWDAKSYDSLALLVDIIEQLKNDPDMMKYPVSWSVDDLDRLLKSVEELQRSKSLQQKVKFEWFSSDLVKAIENGEWVVLDNANLCNPTVLDRINSLAEPDGSIVINECGLVEGKPMILHAHARFRMFLTVNPQYGEVSRAMRNRGVEIFLLEKDGSLVNDQIQNHEVNLKSDVARFLVSSGIARWELVSAMTDAHMFAKETGSRLGIRISLLELTRWVQLLQQLLLKGNQLMWSLQLSYEHIYLPSLGEVEGLDAILEGKSKFLTCLSSGYLDLFPGYSLSLPGAEGKSQFLTGYASDHSNLLSSYSLSLPGGWPSPLKLRDFVWHSREACVRKKCMYLESLGAQCAAYELSRCCSGTEDALWRNRNVHLSVMPVNLIRQLLFPGKISTESENILSGFDTGLANQMLFFAANWVIEQVTDRDLYLYVKLFELYGSQFETYCNFFSSFGTIFVEKHGRPIWEHIFLNYREVVSHFKIDTDEYPLPFLSSKLMELTSSDNALKSCHASLGNALDCVKLFLLSRQQWNTEKWFSDKKKVESLLPLLKSLRLLETKVLGVIVEQKLCDIYADIIDIYADIIEYHRVFWKTLVSSQSEYLLLSWSFLEKEVIKLSSRFPVKRLLAERSKLKNLPVFNFGMQKPTLWMKGGHPFVPSSGAVFKKVQEILTFLNDHWPRKEFSKQNFNGNCSLVDAVLSTDVKLKWLAMDGTCMSEIIVSKFDEDDSKILAQLEEIYQPLLRRVKSERKNLELIFDSGKERTIPRAEASLCCLMSSAAPCRRDSFRSWQAALPLLDLKSANLDILLLPKLVEASWLDSNKTYQHIEETLELVKYALNYSLEFSSRSPVELAPLRVISWIQEKQALVDSACTKIAAATMQMWYNFHSALWNCFSGPLKGIYNEPYHLTRLSKTAALSTILQDTASIRDYDMSCFKLRLVFRNLWEDAQLPGGLVGTLHSAADHLLKQIFLVHKKHFRDEAFGQLKSILIQLSENGLTVENLNSLGSLISSSTHDGLSSLWNQVVEPLLKELYTKCPSSEVLYNLGCAWFHIGELRFELLLSSYGIDPAMKYAFKHSHVLEKTSLVELDIKVRHECEQLSGCSIEDYQQDKRQVSLQKLGAEEKKLRAKVVFRSQLSRFQELRKACVEFKELISICSSVVVDNLRDIENLQLAVDKACSWQITSANFIKRLSEEFAEYIDLIQPIQVAIYEMKLGLSAALSGSLEREYLKMAKEENTDGIFVAISSFAEFPARTAFGQFLESEHSVVDPIETKFNQACAANLLKNLVAISSKMDSDKQVSYAKINHVALVRIAYRVFSSLFLDKTSFMLMHDMFNQFNDLWFEMKKSTSKNEENDEERLVKFKPRLIKLEDVMEGDISFLLESDADQDVKFKNEIEERMEEEFINSTENGIKEDGVTEEVWENISESTLNNLVLIHNQLFGSEDLIQQVGRHQITAAQKLHCFMDSYDVGTRIIKDLESLTSSKLDENLTLEHLLRVCLEYDSFSLKRDKLYNAYKDPNAFVLSKMVEPLSVIQDRVNIYMIDWPEHPVLQRILKINETLLSMSLNSPLSKALQGLQLLVGRIQSLQETDSRYSFKAQLPPVYVLVSSWQKLELESWPAMICGVEETHDASAGRLWFPLRAVLQKEQLVLTIKSIEDFIQSSTIGEFKRRVQLLLALHGELSRCITCDILSSSMMGQKLDVLYNAFGYYVQFVPLVSEHIESERRSIEKELKENVKLYRWEQDPNVYSIERFKKSRHKAFKLVQRYNEFLQRPVMITFLNKQVTEAGTPAWLDQKETETINGELPQFPVDLVELRNAERFLWYDGWRSKADSVLQSSVEYFKDEESVVAGVNQEWVNCWESLESICLNAAELGHALRTGKKNHKRRAFTDLLKMLEACGLSKHRPVNTMLGGDLDHQTSLFVQPSYEIEHLLLHQQGNETYKEASLVSTEPSRVAHEDEWKSANKCYFKCLTMIQQFFQSSLKFHKDLDLEQVIRAKSFMDHLMDVLGKQRHSAYGLFQQLSALRDQYFLLENSGSLSIKQKAILKCMWQQKRLFDSLLALSMDTNLLLGLFEDFHLSNCKEIRDESATFSSLIKGLQPGFKQCKEWLDNNLIGGTTALRSCIKRMPLATKDMEKKLESNMYKICKFEEQLQGLAFKAGPIRSVMHVLISRFRELINEGKKIEEDFKGARSAHQPTTDFSNRTFEEVIKLVRDALLKLKKPGGVQSKDEELKTGNITLWKDLLESQTTSFQIDQICDSVDRVINETRNMVELDSSKPDASSSVEVHLNGVYQHLGLILAFSDGLLSEFLDAHKMTCKITHALGQVLMLLFTEGFGSSEEPTETDGAAGAQDVKGTGMGEGQGAKDVSDEIEDESQIVGTEEKQDVTDKSDTLPSGKDKGIEMEEDFNGDMCSVSEDSGEEDVEEDDNEEPNIESQMGDAGENKEAVTEKSWDGKDGDENPEPSSEKYESGSSVKETDPSTKELRAKDDDSLGVDETETEKFDEDEAPQETKEENQTAMEDDEKDQEGMEMDKSEAFEGPTGVEFQEPDKPLEDAEMDDAENAEPMDGTDQDGVDDEQAEEEDGKGEEKPGSPNDIEQDNITTEDNEEVDISGAEHGKNEEPNMESKEDIDNSDNIESMPDPSQAMPMTNFNGFDPNTQPEANWANTNDVSSSLAPGSDTAKLEISIPDSSYGSRQSSDSKPQDTEKDAPIDMQMQQSNPFRSIGDALQEWKERAKVSSDQDQAEAGPDDVSDMDADEYMYVAEGQKSTSQAFGAATSDQMERNIDEGTRPTTDESNVKKREEASRVDTVENPEKLPFLRSCKSLVHRDETDDENVEKTVDDMDTPMEEAPAGDSDLQSYQDVVLFNRSYMDGKNTPLDESLTNGDHPSDEGNMDISTNEDMQNAVIEWKRHELSTTRLSQELTEQLRLVMEPTLASKLQGDYRTGKRINMKKVIPYIASHFRKDKIWLRRTKPNKRNYQVVVAVDDSRSMSESQCGKVAIEALVTVCRAMSQLEVGQFAVARFGEKGKIKLLHDFDQTFTTEAGIKMISNFSFKQDNTIADEPVVDLLKYLNNMLDMAVARSRTPSGQNPLHQLVLILADGRFHEKETLRRCVRDVLSRKRMVAFILLDSPSESIMDMMEATFEGDKLSFRKYLNSFPFPYYIVLKDIEALPRTLADLLRQWFELMQSLHDD